MKENEVCGYFCKAIHCIQFLLELSWSLCDYTAVDLPLPTYVWDKIWRQRCHKRAYNLAQVDLSLLRWRHHTRIKNAKLRSLAFEESETHIQSGW